MEELKSLLKSEMENTYTIAVPLDVEIGLGLNWLEAH
jgi:DNA polymerase-1